MGGALSKGYDFLYQKTKEKKFCSKCWKSLNKGDIRHYSDGNCLCCSCWNSLDPFRDFR